MRLSRLGLTLLRGYAAVIALCLVLGAPTAALVVLALALINGGVIGYRLLTFGRLMHRIVEAVARHSKLHPAEPLRDPLPPGARRTA